MKFKIVKNTRLIDGESYDDGFIEIDTKKSVSFSICRKFYVDKPVEKYIYVQVGNFLDKDFQEFEVFENDMIIIDG